MLADVGMFVAKTPVIVAESRLMREELIPSNSGVTSMSSEWVDCDTENRICWSPTNGGLRDGGLSKSEDI